MNTFASKFALAILAFCSAIAAAGEKKLTDPEVPRPVHEAFQKAYPHAKGLKFEQGSVAGKTVYEVEFKDQGREIEAIYAADGTLIETEEEIAISELPAAVLNAVKTAHPNRSLKEAEKILKPDGTVHGYEVEIKQGKKEFEIELDANGTILKTEADDRD